MRTLPSSAGESGTSTSRSVLRHSYASLLIATGANVKYVQSQLGHTSAAMTLDVYAVLWHQAGQGERAKAELEAQFANAMGSA
jgi:site-specific recombinase XerD